MGGVGMTLDHCSESNTSTTCTPTPFCMPPDPVEAAGSRRGAAPRRPGFRWPALAATAALIAVAGIGGWAAESQQQERQRLRVMPEQARVQDRWSDLLAAEDLSVEQVEVEGQSARLLASSSRNEALLISADLRGPGYQLWPMHDGTSSPDASFAGGEVGVWLDGAVEGADAVVLTTEPTGESPVPTTDPLAIIRL